VAGDVTAAPRPLESAPVTCRTTGHCPSQVVTPTSRTLPLALQRNLCQVKRRLLRAFWRVVNPPTRLLAGIAPWWVLLETTGNRTGRTRRTPLAAGPVVDGEMLLIAVHGRCGWVRNIEAQPAVRLRHRGRTHESTATVQPFDPELARRFNVYARSGPRIAGIDPVIVRVSLR
jgi:deazaflavin-dependent oxidoreductase (nitroreductase family)